MITDVALLVVSAILASEIFMRLPLMHQVTLIVGTARRSAATVRSRRISDHWNAHIWRARTRRIEITTALLDVIRYSPNQPVGQRLGYHTGEGDGGSQLNRSLDERALQWLAVQ